MATYGEFYVVFRNTGYVTGGQASDPAEMAVKLIEGQTAESIIEVFDAEKDEGEELWNAK